MSVNKRRGSGRSGGSSTATGSASKKSVRAAEQDRPDVAAARTAWADNQPKLDPDRLVFIDETGTSTKMARLRGRAPRGERLVGKIPHGHWKTTTFVAGLRSTALTAPCVIDGPMNGNAFLAYVEKILAPTLKPGDIVVLDNLSAHKVQERDAQAAEKQPLRTKKNSTPREKDRSVLRDHRAAEAVIDARRDQINVLVYPFGAQHLADKVANSNGAHIGGTHEQVIVLDGK
jgi:hypothetical protein